MNKKMFKINLGISFTACVFLCVFIMLSFGFTSSTHAEDTSGQVKETVKTVDDGGVKKVGLIAAAIAFGLGALGAGFAIAHVGAAAMGAIGEKPEIAGQALIFIALAEGLVVFGFITALMILGRI